MLQGGQDHTLRAVDKERVSPDWGDNGSGFRMGALGRSPLGGAEWESGWLPRLYLLLWRGSWAFA